ncbi:PREDICTED: DNA topoisomerase 2-binding protein 1 [Dufourea novaeangliae]|uniref:DNA topoisomerase 2-binding protein 1 n=1 Tax=Dufourea novaeangliae TaxID=178035 RepID=UPI00076725BF|nr:PREDICTED: DNA topoisomerase 2-binding protein 1 [Dufourea novaeangliae]
MVNEESQIDPDVNLYFVVPSKYKTEDNCVEDMWHAYNKCCEHDLQPIWVHEKKCNSMKPVKNDVFIMEEFKGDTFEKLKTFKCPVVGPRCLLLCFMNGEPIPEGTSPVYTTTMRGLCICASGLPPQEKEYIEKLVEYMGGIFTKQLRSRVTHLVTGSVMSAKYETAIDLKIPIVTKEWVEAIWDINLKEFVKADDSMFDKYKASVFLNLIVTSTNLPKRQKEEIKQLINNHGGTFMGALDGSKVKVVLAPEKSPISEKLKYAKQANIACLTPNWVYESVKVGYALPFKDFLIKSLKACSTPEKSHAFDTFDCSTISSIPCDVQQDNCVDESLITTRSNFSTMDSLSRDTSSVAVLDRLTFSEAKSAGPFLDGCNIYLAGIASNQRDKLNKILNVGSATRLDDISDALTHVIVGDANKATSELRMMKSKGLCPYILTLEWLAESIKLKRPAPEENYLFEQQNNIVQKVPEPPSPLSKRNLQMLQKPKKVPIPSFDIDKKMAMLKKERESDLVQQYLQDTVVATSEKTIQEFLKPHTPTVEENNDKTLINDRKSVARQSENMLPSDTLKSKYGADDSAVPISQTSTLNDRLFEGHTFVVTGFTEKDSYVAETIAAMGGQIVTSSFAGIPDYGVVPKCGAPLKHTVNEIVTDLFIEDCVNQELIIEIMYYHRPLSIKKHSNPLSGCVITMSMYTGVERTYLATLATKLGAMCQDIFVRKTNLERNTYGSTHLVCPTPEGNKYNAAVKWKLPAVTADWLKACAVQSKRVDETPYLVGETIAPERPNETSTTNTSTSKSNVGEMCPPTESSARNIITPKRHLPNLQSQEGSSGETPLINKRLSLLMNKTPQSPFHVSTPETPYGQVFKSNPSPDTRKGWVKWVDNFPDLRVEEPPLKRRALSTPLSELKKQLWQKLKNQGQNESVSDENETLHTDSTQPSAPETPEARKNYSEVPITTPINRKLQFANENSPLQNNEINMQIAQLDQVLQRTSSTPENRYSLSGENANTYNAEPSDPIQKFIVKDSQPIDAIVWEDPSHSKQKTIYDEQSESAAHNSHTVENEVEEEEEQPKEPSPPKKLRFMLSGIRDRTACEQVIKDLGGDVSLDASFDMSATHLLCMRPSRNEKMLGSIASGKWILHCMYLQDCEQEGKFLDEEKYEWGNPKSKGVIPDPAAEVEEMIAAAAHKWRLKLLKEPNGPFHNMVALILATGEKYDQFRRLVETGGGKVVQARPPYDTSPKGKKITHCFVNAKQVSQPIDWAMLASKGILCFMPQYLSDHLTTRTPLNPRECVIPEFKKYLALLPK